MHSEEARTPAPTYGTSSNSSSPCTVPSSPNGPCRTGKATSAPSRPPPGRTASASPSGPLQRPSRSSRTGTHVVAGGDDALHHRGAGDLGDLVLRRAAAVQHGDPHGDGTSGVGGGRRRLGGRGRGRGRRGRRREAADAQDDARALRHLLARARVLREDDAVLRRVRHVLVTHRDLEAGVRQGSARVVLRHRARGHVGHLDVRRRGRHHDFHGRALGH